MRRQFAFSRDKEKSIDRAERRQRRELSSGGVNSQRKPHRDNKEPDNSLLRASWENEIDELERDAKISVDVLLGRQVWQKMSSKEDKILEEDTMMDIDEDEEDE